MMKTTQEMVDAIRKGDKLSHKAMQNIANKLDWLRTELNTFQWSIKAWCDTCDHRNTSCGLCPLFGAMNPDTPAQGELPGMERVNTDWEAKSERLREALQNIIDNGDYTAPEGMKRIAKKALTENGG